jgi:pimeloyl-ACP methyl ester carboxylesterase
MPQVRANGLSFHVQEMGAATAPPVVLAHGLFLGNMAAWYFLVAPALAQRHRVVLYDQRGHGRTDRAETGYDLATLTADLEGLVENVGGPGGLGGPLDLVGHSYGALVCLAFARRHPERVRRLVLVEAPLPPHRVEETADILSLDREELRRTLEPETLRSNVLGYEHATELLDTMPARARRAILKGRRGLRRMTENLWHLLAETTIVQQVKAEPDLDDAELAAIAHPTLCVYGKHSSCRGVADRILSVMPDARLAELDAGHYVMNERPRELTDAIVGFLDGDAAGG